MGPLGDRKLYAGAPTLRRDLMQLETALLTTEENG